MDNLSFEFIAILSAKVRRSYKFITSVGGDRGSYTQVRSEYYGLPMNYLSFSGGGSNLLPLLRR